MKFTSNDKSTGVFTGLFVMSVLILLSPLRDADARTSLTELESRINALENIFDQYCADGSVVSGISADGTIECTSIGLEPSTKTVFVTSQSWAGDLGGLAGADRKCQDSASAAGLSGVFYAWLSNTVDSPDSRFIKSTVPYVMVDGTRVADDWNDLVSGDLQSPIQLTEYGGDVSYPTAAWTNTLPTGLMAYTSSMVTCDEWTSQNFQAIYGDTTTTSQGWTHSPGAPCLIPLHLYCFQQ